MAIVANLDILLGARTEKLDQGFDRSTAKVKRFEADVGRMGKAAEATLSPLRQLGQGLLAAIPGASAAAAAFSAIAAAFAGGVAAKVAKETKETAVASTAAAVQMTEFATAAAAAAVATGLIRRNSSGVQFEVPRIGTRGLSTDIRPRRDDDDVLDAEFRRLDSVPRSFGAASAAIGGMGAAGVAAGAAVAAAFVGVATAAVAAGVTIRGVREQFLVIDEMAKSASAAGVAFRELAAFRFAGGEAGLGPEQADKALAKMQVTLTEARKNGGALDQQLRALGLDAGQLLQAGPIEAMKQLSTATVGLKSPADQLTLAYKVFGKEGLAVLNVLKGGPDALSASLQVAEQLGLTLSDSQAKQVEAANDAWGRMELIATGAFRQIAAEVSPVITIIVESITGVATGFSGWQTYLPPIVDSLAMVAGNLYDVVELANSFWIALAKASAWDFSGAAESLRAGLDFGTGSDLVSSIQQARDQAAKNSPSSGTADLSAIEARMEAEKAAAESAKRIAEDRARTAQQNRDAIRERMGSLREEIATMRMGADAVERMKLARQGATAQQLRGFDAMTREKQQLEQITDAMERGKQLREQFASPQQQLNREMQDLHQLLNVGAIDFATFARASREAAGRLGKQEPKRSADTPSFGALQKGSVEAFSAALRNDKAGRQDALQKEGNATLKSINTHMEQVAQRLGVQTMGAV